MLSIVPPSRRCTRRLHSEVCAPIPTAESSIRLERRSRVCSRPGARRRVYQDHVGPERPCEPKLELDFLTEAGTQAAALRYRVRDGSPGQCLILEGEGWRHLHLTVRGSRHTLEVDGRTLASVDDVARGEGTLAFERPTAGRVWITHLRLRSLRR